MPSVPGPILAALGLVATAVERVRSLPERAPELPVQLVGHAMQLSLRAQQHYTELTTKGDGLLGHLRGAPDEPPAWATFDDELPPDLAQKVEFARTAFDRVDEPDFPDDVDVVDAPALPRVPESAAVTAPRKAPAKKAPAKKATGQEGAAREEGGANEEGGAREEGTGHEGAGQEGGTR